jgi:hypothetical protein
MKVHGVTSGEDAIVLKCLADAVVVEGDPNPDDTDLE